MPSPEGPGPADFQIIADRTLYKSDRDNVPGRTGGAIIDVPDIDATAFTAPKAPEAGHGY